MKQGTVSVGFLHPGRFQACFAQSLMDLMFFDASHKQRITSHPFGQIAKEGHASRIHVGRNEIVQSFLDDSDAEWLFFIDADMGFSPTVVEDLIDAADPKERPVVGGLCFGQKTDGTGEFHAQRARQIPTIFTMAETVDEVGFVPMLHYPRNELVKCDATGAACVLIHRSILELIREQYGESWFSLMEISKGKRGRTEFSEDMSFCVRVIAVGKSVYVHTGVKTTHDKGGIFLDETTYDLQQVTRRATNARFGDWILATGGLLSTTECAEVDFFASRATGPALEVGNYTGLSTIVISRALPKGTPFTTIDPHDWRATSTEFEENLNRWAGPVRSVHEPFETALPKYDGPPFGFVFYDGPHTPEHCEAFWSAVEPHLADDAVICWDDADWASMARLTELVAPGRAYLAREPIRRYQISYSTGVEQVDLDLAKRHPDTCTIAVWGPK